MLIGLMTCLAVLVFQYKARALELGTDHTTIVYDHEFLLRDLEANLSASKAFFIFRRKKPDLTITDEIRTSVDNLVERVETILEMYPPGLHITIILLPSAGSVQSRYAEKYGKATGYIAFYSPKDKTIFLSVRDVSIRVLGHEIAHAVVAHHFIVPPPVKVHEVLAQYVEAQLID